MKSPSLAASAVVCAALLLAPPLVQGQPLPRDPAERARVIAQILEANARQLTLFDRRGQAVGTVGLRDLYNQPVLSPDAKRVAVVKPDLDKEANDLWVIDVATARATQITTSKSREGANSPAWSPDGGTLAYVALRDGYFGVYRKALHAGRAGGTAVQELGAADAHRLVAGRPLPRLLLDRPDGRRPVRAADRRARANGSRSRSSAASSRHRDRACRPTGGSCPSSRTRRAATRSTSSRSIPPRRPARRRRSMPQQISDQGGMGMAFWRRDGKELYYLAADRGIMAVDVGAGAPAQFGKPRVLFRPAAEIVTGRRPEQRQRQPRRRALHHRGAAAADAPAHGVTTGKGTALSKVGHARLLRAAEPVAGRHARRVDAQRSADRQPGHLGGRPGQRQGHGHHERRPSGERADLVAGREAGGLCVDARGARRHLSQVGRWHRRGRAALPVHARRRHGAHRLVAGREVHDLLHRRARAGAGRTTRSGRRIARRSTGCARTTTWAQGRFSPDNRFLAYLSNEDNVERGEVYVRPFDPAKPDAPPPGNGRAGVEGRLGRHDRVAAGRQGAVLHDP